MAATKHEKTCPACGLPHPTQKHFFAHKANGTLVQVSRLVGKCRRMLWEVPEPEQKEQVTR